eukprot:scaffold16580_cov37-Cyclotella_meneghiniana.AAC.3
MPPKKNMPPRKKSKTEPLEPQPQPQPLTALLRERFLQACINFWSMYVYFCVYRFQENEDCGLSTVCTILACESFTRSAALSYWFPSLNAFSMDPGAIETPEGAIDIMAMLCLGSKLHLPGTSWPCWFIFINKERVPFLKARLPLAT